MSGPKHGKSPEAQTPAQARVPPPPFRLEFYVEEDGRQVVRDWLRGLSLRKKQVLGAAMFKVLQHLGVEVCQSEFGRQLEGGLKSEDRALALSPPMPGDLDSFLEEVRAESRAAGPEVVAGFEAALEHFELARQLIELRKAHGWTQQRLSKRSGVQQSEISRIERLMVADPPHLATAGCKPEPRGDKRRSKGSKVCQSDKQ